METKISQMTANIWFMKQRP